MIYIISFGFVILEEVLPSTEWRRLIAYATVDQLEGKWNFLHCVGAIGKHIVTVKSVNILLLRLYFNWWQ